MPLDAATADTLRVIQRGMDDMVAEMEGSEVGPVASLLSGLLSELADRLSIAASAVERQKPDMAPWQSCRAFGLLAEVSSAVNAVELAIGVDGRKELALRSVGRDSA